MCKDPEKKQWFVRVEVKDEDIRTNFKNGWRGGRSQKLLDLDDKLFPPED